MPIEMLVPIGIFVAGILVSISAGSTALQRMVEGQKASGKDLTHTQAYEAPFLSGDQAKK